jgi:hypothetical protein
MRPTAATSIRTDQRVPSPPPDQPCERTSRSLGGCSTRDDVLAQICLVCEARATQKLSPGRTGISDSGRCSVFRWHATRLTAPGGPALHELRTAVSRRECAPSDRAGSFRDIPRAGRQLARHGLPRFVEQGLRAFFSVDGSPVGSRGFAATAASTGSSHFV